MSAPALMSPRVSAIAWFYVVHRDLLVHEDMPTATVAEVHGEG